MDKQIREPKSRRVYRNVCQCRRCKEEFLFSEALAQKAAFGLTNKICPNCGSSDITFIKFADNNIKSYVDKFKLPI